MTFAISFSLHGNKNIENQHTNLNIPTVNKNTDILVSGAFSQPLTISAVYDCLFFFKLVLLTSLLIFYANPIEAQNGNIQTTDSLQKVGNTLLQTYDSKLQTPADSLQQADSVFQISGDSISPDTTNTQPSADSLKKKSSVGLESQVKYKSFKKIHYDIRNKKVFLYEDAEIEYGDIGLKADYVEINFAKNQVFARGIPDSTGKMSGEPVFSEGEQKFESKELTYNFDTKKGLIRSVITQDGEGYLHGEKIKKMADDRINIWHGKYTTCDHKVPHYEFRYTKAQVIPNNKIVSGPAYLVIEGVPVPLALPFGLFPNKDGHRSGILIPAFGETANRGFYLERGGYYWSINDYLDFTITGDIFTQGSWAVRPTIRYLKRYKYNGNFDFSYGKNIIGDKDDPNNQVKKDFSVRWSHAQDAKARPNSRFSANVNIVSNSFSQYNLSSNDAYLSNTFQSSVAYQTNFNNNLFLTVNASHQQNTIDRSMNITLPSLTFNTKQFYPLRRKNPTGKERWYENINIKYSTIAENRISTYDSLVFTPGWEEDFRYGMKHTIPVSSSIKVLKYFTLTNSINLSEKWYPSSTRKYWVNDTMFTATDTIVGYVETDTLSGFAAAHEFSYSASLNTRLYGMYQFTNFPITAIRHVITPGISFSYHPDFGGEGWGYYDEYQYNDEGLMKRYSIFEGSLYGGPPDGKSGRVSFSLANNLEMKVRSKSDTITGYKKVVLIDNFSLGTSYDLAKDSLNWSPLSMSGRTTLFKKLNVTYSSSWDPYAVDSSGRTINKFEWNVNKKLFRMTSTSWNFSINYRISSADLKKNKNKVPDKSQDPAFIQKYSEQERNDVLQKPDQYVDWNNPWSISFSYSLALSNNPRYINYLPEDNRNSVQTIGITGDINITPKWKVMFRTGYDFENKKISFTSVDFYRDLHCWEMRFNWVPIGFRKSWSFTINVKSSILKDLKYDRKKDFRDSY